LATRVLLPLPWPAFSRSLDSWTARLLAAVGIFVQSGLIAYLILWAMYGFRFAAPPDSQAGGSIKQLEKLAPRTDVRAALHPESDPTPEELRTWRPNAAVRLIRFASEHKLAPHPWLAGFLYTHATSVIRSAFLLGERSDVGWWYYFPLAILFKTPSATLLAF